MNILYKMLPQRSKMNFAESPIEAEPGRAYNAMYTHLRTADSNCSVLRRYKNVWNGFFKL